MSGYVLHLPEEESVVLSGPAARRLVSAGNGDAALLYIALVQNRGAADGEKLRAALGWPTERFAAAFQALESQGLVGLPQGQAPSPAPPPVPAARKAGPILENTRSVLAYELLTACQAIDIRRRAGTYGQGLSPVGEAVYRRVRQEVDFMEEDRELWPDIRAVEVLVRSGELLDLAEALVPELQ